MDDKLLDRLLESGILSNVLADELTTTLDRIGMTLEEAIEQALWNWYLDSAGAHRMEKK